MSLPASLCKIRSHTSSTLAHQKAPASLLIALESTLTEQGAEHTSTAYFAALLAILESSKSNSSFKEGDRIPAILYLLALVTPYVSFLVIRSHLSTLLTLLTPLLPALLPHAPALRSHLTLFSPIIRALDTSQLDIPEVRQTFNLILDLTLDPRPKVRRKAADLVREVLENPPSPLLRHPYGERVGEWFVAALTTVSSGAGTFGRHGKKAAGNDSPQTGIHLIAAIKPIMAYLPPDYLPVITSVVLSLPRLGNPYLAHSSYTLLTTLVTDDSPSTDLSPLIEALLSSSPLKTDVAQTPAWLDLLRAAFASGPVSHSNQLGAMFKTIFEYLESTDINVRNNAAQALSAFLSKSITNTMIEAAIAEKEQKNAKSPISKIIALIRSSLGALPYAHAVPQMFTVLASLLHALRHRPSNKSSIVPPTAAELLVLDLVEKAGELRIKKGFEHKESVDEVLKAAMGVLGPEVILRVLPLRLLPEERTAGLEPHAYILPLLSIPHPSPLSHFISYFVPLSERVFDLQQVAEREKRHNEAKMWDVLIGQIWSGLVGYCHATKDLPEAFNTTFAQLLSQILYNQPHLRPAILKALKVIVESNFWVTSDIVTIADANRNLEHLRSQAESWFAVLFNVFGSVGQETKGMVGDVISVWAKIAGNEEIVKMYLKVVTLFQQNLANPTAKGSKQPEGPAVTLMTQDLLILLLPYLPQNECKELWTLCTSHTVIGNEDAGVQKRCYRILSKLVQSGKLSSVLDAEKVLTELIASAETVGAPAKRDRVTLLSLLLPSLPKTSLHLIPSLIPEAVLATKEPAERTRAAAFDFVVGLGKKMKEGGVVKRSRMDGMDENDENANEVEATIEEYMTMVGAGLAGATPHMISASITAISRLVFEFKDDIQPNILDEILSTMLVFLGSANREIVKSALGFIKLSVHTLPVEMVILHLKQLVPSLLNWSGDHKNHFKVKVRHIFERMIRRFGWEAVYGCVGHEADEKEKGKVLLNIKKRKDRAKRKKAKNVEDGEGDENGDDAAATQKTSDAFEDVLYGSESEIEEGSDDDVGDHPQTRAAGKGRGAQNDKGVRIRVDDDEPMDLLQGAVDKLMTGSKNRRRKPGQDASSFKLEEATGRMIIEEKDQDIKIAAGDELAGAAYKETLTSVDGFTRGPNGRIKFNKDTKKRRHANEDHDDDVDMVDGAMPAATGNKKRKKEPKLGHEFKAKNAGGDVKRGGVDPYAYLPLSQAAKKKGVKNSRVNVVGRR